jgi:hypothetical protein
MNRMIISVAALVMTMTGQVMAGPAESTASLPQPLAASDLAHLSGGSSLALTNQNLDAVNTGNQVNADSVTTGDINVPNGAFDGFNGVGNFVFNTGNNNNLQGTLSVTIVAPAN